MTSFFKNLLKRKKLFIVLIALFLTILFFLIAPFISQLLLGSSNPEELQGILGDSVFTMKNFRKYFTTNLLIAFPIYIIIAFYLIPKWVVNAPAFQEYKENEKISNKELKDRYIASIKNKTPLVNIEEYDIPKKSQKLLFWNTIEGKLISLLILFLFDISLVLIPTLI